MSLQNVIGHYKAMGMLHGTLRRGRVASSYLFAGEQGIGKRFTAINFVKAVNCMEPVELDGRTDACDRCESCRRMDSRTHMDFTLVEPEGGVIKVEGIRRLEESLSLKPFDGGRKAVIVDDAETMNISAANAFLKTLEEPPAESLIILVTSAPDRLPQTIRSRCLRINFKPLSREDCLKVLGKRSGDRQQMVRLSMGRPGLAVREDLVKQRARFMSILGKSSERDAKHPWKDRQDMERWLDTSLVLLRDMAVLRLSGDPEALINRDEAGAIGAACSASGVGEIMDSYFKMMRLRENTRFNPNRAIVWNCARSLFEQVRLGADR